jgi:hypothetical protein
MGDAGESDGSLEQRVAALEALVRRHEDNFRLVADLVRFGPLRDRLAAGDLIEADRETARVLFDWVGSTADAITPEAIEVFPATPLQIVDRLWSEASGGRFGFTAQLRIYRGLGGSLDTLIAQDGERFRHFCERVGWGTDGLLANPDEAAQEPVEDSRVGPELQHDALPDGALPRRCWCTSYGMKLGNLLLARLITAGLEAGAPAPHGGEPSG